MGRRSPKLAHKEAAVKALFAYAKLQSGMTQIELEEQLIPSYRQSKNKRHNQEAVSGNQWSRWANGYALPEIGLVKQLFDSCVQKLISGEWKENGLEGEWADLLVVVSDQRSASLSKHRFALKIAYSSLNAPSIITKEMIRGIEFGYYIPPDEDIEKLFFTKMLNTQANAMQRTDRAIMFRDEAEQNALQAMLKEIETNFGDNKQDKVRLAKFNRRWGLTGDGVDWADKLLLTMQEDVAVLSEIADRYISLGGGVDDSMDEVKIGYQLKQDAMQLQKRIEEVSMGEGHQKIEWKNELHFFNMKVQGLDGALETRYLSVVEVPEIDHAGRHAQDLHPHLFAPIL